MSLPSHTGTLACLTPDPLFRHGEPQPSSVGTGMPSPKNFSFVPEKNFQLPEELQEQYGEFPYSPCTNSSIVHILLYMRCHPLCIYTYISILVTLFYESSESKLQTGSCVPPNKTRQNTPFPQTRTQPHASTAIRWENRYDISLLHPVSRAHSELPAPSLVLSDSGSSSKAHVTLSVYTPADSPVWKWLLRLPLPFVTFKGTARSLWKNPQPVSL